jgi:hypothetical protein
VIGLARQAGITVAYARFAFADQDYEQVSKAKRCSPGWPGAARHRALNRPRNGAIASSWSLYVLIVVGAATMLLAAQALAADPLAASQPGFTILDPQSASMLGLFLFGEHIQAGIADLADEAAALALVIAGGSALRRSHLILGEHGTPPGPQPDTRRTSTANRLADDRSAGRGAGSSSGVLVLRGRAGMGKTALLREMAERAASGGMRSAQGAGMQRLEARPGTH